MSSFGRIVAVAGIASLLLAGTARAQPAEGDTLRQAVQKYLESVEEGAAAVTDEVIQEHERRLEAAARYDPRVTFAKMFVAARRGQFRTANKLFTTLPRNYRQSLLVLRTKIWASVNTADDVDAQREMIYLIHFAERQGGVAKSWEAAEFAGTMYGYLAGPAGRPQKDMESEVFRRIASEYQPFFTAGRAEVMEHFAAIEIKLGAAREKAQAAEAKLRERELQKITARCAELEKQMPPLLASLQQAESELASQLDVDQDHVHLLTRQMLDLENESAMLSKRITSLKERIAELREAADKETDPTRKQLLLNEAARFEDDARRLETERDRQDTRRAALLARRRAAQASIDKKTSVLDPQRRAVRELAAELDGLRRREHELRTAPLPGLSPEVAALEQQARALETYLPDFWTTATTSILQSFE